MNYCIQLRSSVHVNNKAFNSVKWSIKTKQNIWVLRSLVVWENKAQLFHEFYNFVPILKRLPVMFRNAYRGYIKCSALFLFVAFALVLFFFVFFFPRLFSLFHLKMKKVPLVIGWSAVQHSTVQTVYLPCSLSFLTRHSVF